MFGVTGHAKRMSQTKPNVLYRTGRGRIHKPFTPTCYTYLNADRHRYVCVGVPEFLTGLTSVIFSNGIRDGASLIQFVNDGEQVSGLEAIGKCCRVSLGCSDVYAFTGNSKNSGNWVGLNCFLTNVIMYL